MIEQFKEKISDWIYDLFNPPVLPYIYKVSPNYSSSFIGYFIFENENLYINKDGTYAVLYKLSVDDYLNFMSFLKNYETLSFFDYVGISYTEDTVSLDNSFLFWGVKEMSIDPLDIDINYKKMLKGKNLIEKKMSEKGFVFGKVSPKYLINHVSNISWYQGYGEYTGEKPLSFNFRSSPLVLRDELFYSYRDLYMLYSIKSTYIDSFEEIFSNYPYNMIDLEFEKEFPYVATYTTLIDYKSKYNRDVVSFLLLKFPDGVNILKKSDYYKYNRDYKCVDFSKFEDYISLNLISKSSDIGVNLQREQKNLSFFYGLSCLPFNNVYGKEGLFSKRLFHIHSEV